MSVTAHKRRPSGARLRRSATYDSTFHHPPPWQPCHLPPSLLSQASKLAKLRVAVLEHLKDLELHLSRIKSPSRGIEQEPTEGGHEQSQVPGQLQRSRSVSVIVDARAHIDDVLEMLERIRSDVCSHIPDIPGLDFLPDISLDDVRSHMPIFELPELELRIPSTHFTAPLDGVPSSLNRLQSLLSYLPMLKGHLESLHEHISSLQLPPTLSLNFTMPLPGSLISELLCKLQDPDLLTDPLRGPLDFLADTRKGHELDDSVSVENTTIPQERQILHGLIKSHHGERLILIQDLPSRYQNNDYVLTGYRFIPLSRWPRLVLSIFQLHNETTNIWSHLLPILMSIPAFSHSSLLHSVDIPEQVFVLFANICLALSCMWHVMSGCSDIKAMEVAARVDYVGIGWLISASISCVVYYGFSCRPWTAVLYLFVAFTLGIAGSILPFMTFFNERQNKKWRIVFFLSLVFTLVIPLAHLAAAHSLWDMYTFMRPEVPSLAAYSIGLVFYAFHFPECITPIRWTKYTDLIGGGSHAIWHLSIVLAIRLHRDAMVEYRRGIGGEMCIWNGTFAG